MAGFFQQFLRGAQDGFLGSPNLKDYKHASKTFTTNAYSNSPKFKWLFHVYFDINELFSDNAGVAAFSTGTNHGLLVKSIDLPKYSISVQELNQYNRKRFIQNKINYDPIRVTFHDDNGNQIRNLWHTYYSYYYFDPSQPNNLNTGPGGSQSRGLPEEVASKLNPRNIYERILDNEQRNWGYMGENGQSTFSTQLGDRKIPFFKSIKIFGFNQHNFTLYQLINPIIESFQHDSYSYADGQGTMECSMQLKYESVKYYDGAIDGQNPSDIVTRFGEQGVYDRELSPIARAGTNRSILGQGGLVDAAGGIIKDVQNGNILGAIQTAGRVSRTFKNGQQLLQTAQEELVKGAISAASSPQVGQAARSIFSFPALGSNQGTGGQVGNATNSLPTNAPPISTPGNTDIV